MPLPLCFKPLPHPPGFPSMPSADWVPGGLNIWGKTEYPNQPFLKPVGEVPLSWYLDVHIDLQVFFNSSTWRLNVGRCPKNQHAVQLLRMVLYIPLNLWLMVNIMALSRVPGGSMPHALFPPPTTLHWNRPRKNWPSHPLRKRPPFFLVITIQSPPQLKNATVRWERDYSISWTSSVHRTVASIFSLENVKLSIGQTSELVQYGILSIVIYVIHKTHRAQCCLTRRSIAIWRRQTSRQTSESATTSWTTTDQVPMLLSSKKLPSRRGRLRVPNWLQKRGLISCIQYLKTCKVNN